MKIGTILPAAVGPAVGYVLGSAAGLGRYRQITAATQLHDTLIQPDHITSAPAGRISGRHIA